MDDAVITLDQAPAPLRELICAYARRPAVQALRDPARAKAACVQETRKFAQYAAERGIDGEPWESHADDLGFRERIPTPWLQDDSHVVYVARLDDRVLTVDWTAAQYGHTDPFPLVRDVTGTDLPPKMPWLLTEQQAAERMDAIRAHLAAGGSLLDAL